MSEDCPQDEIHCGCVPILRAENQRIQKASIKIGSWMSAALKDAKVCEEMKADIREWFDSLGKE